MLILVGVALLVTALFLGWYSETATVSLSTPDSRITINGFDTFYPFNQFTQKETCSGSTFCPPNSTFTSAYAPSGLGELGALYLAAAGLVIGAIVLGVVAAIGALTHRHQSVRWVRVLTIVVLLLVVIAPTMLALGQPPVLKAEASASGGSTNTSAPPSPSSSFFGSCTGSSCGEALAFNETISASWGPSLGWYLCVAAIAPVFLGILMIARPARRPVNSPLYPPQR